MRLLARHFDQQLDDLEVPVDDLIAQIHQAGMASADDFRRQMSTPETHLLMKAKVSGPSEIAGINVYDADGTLINSSEVRGRSGRQHRRSRLFQGSHNRARSRNRSNWFAAGFPAA